MKKALATLLILALLSSGCAPAPGPGSSPEPPPGSSAPASGIPPVVSQAEPAPEPEAPSPVLARLMWQGSHILRLTGDDPEAEGAVRVLYSFPGYSYRQGQLSPDGRTLLCESASGEKDEALIGERGGWAALDLLTGEAAFLDDTRWNIRQFRLLDDDLLGAAGGWSREGDDFVHGEISLWRRDFTPRGPTLAFDYGGRAGTSPRRAVTDMAWDKKHKRFFLTYCEVRPGPGTPELLGGLLGVAVYDSDGTPLEDFLFPEELEAPWNDALQSPVSPSPQVLGDGSLLLTHGYLGRDGRARFYPDTRAVELLDPLEPEPPERFPILAGLCPGSDYTLLSRSGWDDSITVLLSGRDWRQKEESAPPPDPEEEPPTLETLCWQGSHLVDLAPDGGYKILQSWPGQAFSQGQRSPSGRYLLCKEDFESAGDGQACGYAVLDLRTGGVARWDGLQLGHFPHVFLDEDLIGFADSSPEEGQGDPGSPLRLWHRDYTPRDLALELPPGEPFQHTYPNGNQLTTPGRAAIGVGWDRNRERFCLTYAQILPEPPEPHSPYLGARLGVAVYDREGVLLKMDLLPEEITAPASPNLLSLLPCNPGVKEDGSLELVWGLHGRGRLTLDPDSWAVTVTRPETHDPQGPEPPAILQGLDDYRCTVLEEGEDGSLLVLLHGLSLREKWDYFG